jgi:hypothetical protein
MLGQRLAGLAGVLVGLTLVWGGREIAGRIANQWWGVSPTQPAPKRPGPVARVFGWWIRFCGVLFVVVGFAHMVAPDWSA